MHPTTSSSFKHKVLLNDILHPIPSVWVGEVDHSERDADTLQDVRLAVFVLDEISIVTALFELILSDTFNLASVLNVGVDVDERLYSIKRPLGYHIVPIIVPVFIELPVPDKPCTFIISVLTNPILHPDSDHRKL